MFCGLNSWIEKFALSVIEKPVVFIEFSYCLIEIDIRSKYGEPFIGQYVWINNTSIYKHIS